MTASSTGVPVAVTRTPRPPPLGTDDVLGGRAELQFLSDLGVIEVDVDRRGVWSGVDEANAGIAARPLEPQDLPARGRDGGNQRLHLERIVRDLTEDDDVVDARLCKGQLADRQQHPVVLSAHVRAVGSRRDILVVRVSPSSTLPNHSSPPVSSRSISPASGEKLIRRTRAFPGSISLKSTSKMSPPISLSLPKTASR